MRRLVSLKSGRFWAVVVPFVAAWLTVAAQGGYVGEALYPMNVPASGTITPSQDPQAAVGGQTVGSVSNNGVVWLSNGTAEGNTNWALRRGPYRKSESN